METNNNSENMQSNDEADIKDLLLQLLDEQKKTNHLLGALMLPAKLYFRCHSPFVPSLSGEGLPVHPDVLEERNRYIETYGR